MAEFAEFIPIFALVFSFSFSLTMPFPNQKVKHCGCAQEEEEEVGDNTSRILNSSQEKRKEKGEEERISKKVFNFIGQETMYLCSEGGSIMFVLCLSPFTTKTFMYWSWKRFSTRPCCLRKRGLFLLIVNKWWKWVFLHGSLSWELPKFQENWDDASRVRTLVKYFVRSDCVRRNILTCTVSSVPLKNLFPRIASLAAKNIKTRAQADYWKEVPQSQQRQRRLDGKWVSYM